MQKVSLRPSGAQVLAGLLAAVAVVSTAGAAALLAATPAQALTISSVTSPQPITVTTPPEPLPPYMELPPWFVRPPNGGYAYFLSTNYSYECQAQATLLSGVDCTAANTALVTEDEATICLLGGSCDPSAIPPGTDFKRNYEGVHSAQVLTSSTGTPYIVALEHGENKNEIRAGVSFHNTVQPNDTTCWTGGNPYIECYPDYNAFIASASAPATAATGWGLHDWTDNGPVVWPRNGYVHADGSKASWGTRHAATIVDGGFMYVFYLDTGDASSDPSGLPTQGLGAGIAVARSPTTDIGAPGTFDTWTGNGWAPSLPNGLTAADESQFFATPGPPAAPILGTARGSYYFAVTRIIGAPSDGSQYLGVENYAEPDSRACAGNPAGTTAFAEALWESRNLVQWYNRTVIPQLTACGSDADNAYLHSPLRWAHFLDSSATTESPVDPSNFDLIGTSDTGGVVYVNVSIAP